MNGHTRSNSFFNRIKILKGIHMHDGWLRFIWEKKNINPHMIMILITIIRVKDMSIFKNSKATAIFCWLWLSVWELGCEVRGGFSKTKSVYYWREMATSPLPFENSHVWRIKIEGALSTVFLNHGGIFIMSGKNVVIRILSYRIPGQHASIFVPPQFVWTLCHWHVSKCGHP